MVRKQTELSIKAMAVLALLYGSESLTLTRKHEQRLQSAEMKFWRSVKDFTVRGQIKNKDIRRGLEVCSLNDRVKKGNWLKKLLELVIV